MLGKFPSFDKFIESLEAARQIEERELEQGLSIAARRSRRRQTRDIVEVAAKIHKREPYWMLMEIGIIAY